MKKCDSYYGGGNDNGEMLVILKGEPRVLADVLDIEGEGKRNQEWGFVLYLARYAMFWDMRG